MAKAASRASWRDLRGGTKSLVPFSLQEVRVYHELMSENVHKLITGGQEQLCQKRRKLHATRPHAELHRMFHSISKWTPR